MAVDVSRIQEIAPFMWIAWSAPLQLILAVYLLWGIIGPSVLAGVAVLALLIPVNYVVAIFQRKLQVPMFLVFKFSQ